MDIYDEDTIQVSMVRFLRLLEQHVPDFISYAGDQNAAKRGRSAAPLAKLMGLRPGETDLRIYLAGGRLVSIEVKLPLGHGRGFGRISKAQNARHAQLRKLGFDVFVIDVGSPSDAIGRICSLLIPYMPEHCHDLMIDLSAEASREMEIALGKKKCTGGLAKLEK